ncbi:recombinase [Entomobacter blattae]|nr:recombinase [Entomobacter blattae]
MVENHTALSFGKGVLPCRPLYSGMGEAVARRTVFRPEDEENFGKVADRVAWGNLSLLDAQYSPEWLALRNAIATGALLTSGRHLQHGDYRQKNRNMEVFTNCATAIASFAKFYLLLNGSGVGRSYDDDLMAIDWAYAPDILVYLSPSHPDYPHSREELLHFGQEMGVLGWEYHTDNFDEKAEERVKTFMAEILLPSLEAGPEGKIEHRVEDSREGWAKVIELLESRAFLQQKNVPLLFDLSFIRKAGSPIAGMQNRPAPGPVSLLRGLLNLYRHVIIPARKRDRSSGVLDLWEQALLVDHYLSVEVQVGGARRAARMATKSWRDKGVLRFIKAKEAGGLWTANHSVMVDQAFWQALASSENSLQAEHARRIFEEATRCAYINGEPGFINGDKLEDHRTGQAWKKPVYEHGQDFSSSRYQVGPAQALLAELSRRAAKAFFPVTTNPCGEIALHVTGGYCVIADFAPLLACPVHFESFEPGQAEYSVKQEWDQRVEASVRLGVRFLLRANKMDALYAKEVARTNRIGIGPTGLHEWAWMRFGYDFADLLDERKSSPFWEMLYTLSEMAKEEAASYAKELGSFTPVTVTTIKPAGTTSKLFGLTEGAHLPARRQYIRWVQFKGGADGHGYEQSGSDPLLADYQSRGYPVKRLQSFPGMSIVGFPTVPFFLHLNIGNRLVTASEATPQQQYQWLKLLEQFWIGAKQGNQISYTLKLYTHQYSLENFRKILQEEQHRVKCCSILPTRPDSELGYEYLPEEEVAAEEFLKIVKAINNTSQQEMVDMAHLQCMSGVCPL